MHKIGNYVFDSDRLIIYKDDIDEQTISIINETFPADENYEKVFSRLKELNAEKMKMDKITVSDAGICLTYNCNLRCTYCGYSSSNNSNDKLKQSDIEVFIKDIIKKRTIKKLITKKDEPLVISFTGGGEPTYEWDLLQNVIFFIKSQCEDNNIPLYLKMTTNGMLSDEQIDFISGNFSELMISYDGLPEIQNSNRVSPDMQSTSHIVEHSIREFASRNVPLIIRSTIWKKDYSKMKEMYKHIFSLVTSSEKAIWSIYPTLFEGRAINHIKQQEDVTYRDFLFYYIELIDFIIAEKGENYIKSIDVPILNNDLCSIFCGAHKIKNPWLLPDKSIVACIESKDDRVCIGEIVDGHLIYFDNYTDKFLKMTQEKYSLCRNCIAYRFCRGGCPVWHFRKSTSINEPLECNLQKEYWIYILKAALLGKYSFGWQLEKVNLPNIEGKEIFKLVKS